MNNDEQEEGNASTAKSDISPSKQPNTNENIDTKEEEKVKEGQAVNLNGAESVL